jgi:DNA-binding SARP family transcriptional activator
VIDDKLLTFTGKAQKKVLELLKVLIAYGGREVNVEMLSEALWPDADGDNAYQTFTMTLQRLRRLMHYKDALVLSEGKLSLDTKYIWLDIWAFENGLAVSDEKNQSRALELYKGGFLENEPELACTLSTRERLRRKFLREITARGQYFTQQANYLAATKYYERGLEIDPFAEDYYQLLMQCYLKQGRPAKAAALYQNCYKIFQQQLGVEPGKELQEMYSSLSGL